MLNRTSHSDVVHSCARNLVVFAQANACTNCSLEEATGDEIHEIGLRPASPPARHCTAQKEALNQRFPENVCSHSCRRCGSSTRKTVRRQRPIGLLDISEPRHAQVITSVSDPRRHACSDHTSACPEPRQASVVTTDSPHQLLARGHTSAPFKQAKSLLDSVE